MLLRESRQGVTFFLLPFDRRWGNLFLRLLSFLLLWTVLLNLWWVGTWRLLWREEKTLHLDLVTCLLTNDYAMSRVSTHVEFWWTLGNILRIEDMRKSSKPRNWLKIFKPEPWAIAFTMSLCCTSSMAFELSVMSTTVDVDNKFLNQCSFAWTAITWKICSPLGLTLICA